MNEATASKLIYIEGELQSCSQLSGACGTAVTVSEIFSKLPIRRRELVKNAKSHLSKAVQLVQAYTLLESTARITFFNITKQLYQSIRKEEKLVEGLPTASIKKRAGCIYGRELEEALIEVQFELMEQVKVSGVILNPAHAQRAIPRDMQLFFVNKRFVHTPQTFRQAIRSATKSFSQKAVAYALHLELPPSMVDINLTPDKLDLKLSQEKVLAGKLFEELEKIYEVQSTAESIPMSLKRKWEEESQSVQVRKQPKVEISQGESPSNSEVKVIPWSPMPRNGPKTADQLPFQHISIDTKPRYIESAETVKSPISNQDIPDRLDFLQASFADLQIIGQFNKGFIITFLPPNSLFIIDQHAADEKATFERLMKTTEIHVQPLVVPETLQLPADEEILLLQHLDSFSLNGFNISVQDTDTGHLLKLMTKPMSKGTVFTTSDLYESIGNLKNVEFLTDSKLLSQLIRPKKHRDMFASRACRKAVMIGTALEKVKMEEIVHELSKLEKPWNCPHGRPTVRHLFDLPLFPVERQRPNLMRFSKKRVENED